jgi:hypothetical protein
MKKILYIITVIIGCTVLSIILFDNKIMETKVNFEIPKNIKISQNFHQSLFDKNVLVTVINIKDTLYNGIYDEIYTSTICVSIDNIKKLEKTQIKEYNKSIDFLKSYLLINKK